MAEEIAEFEIGKRHLANMMGADPDAFTQEDVDVWDFHQNSKIRLELISQYIWFCRFFPWVLINLAHYFT